MPRAVVLRDCAVAAPLGFVVGLAWLSWLHSAHAAATEPLDDLGVDIAGLVIGVPGTLLLTMLVYRFTGVRPVLPVTGCTILTSACALFFVHALQLGGHLGPAWEYAVALAVAYTAGALIAGGWFGWPLRIALSLVFLLLLPAGVFANHEITRRDLHTRLAALQVPLLVPRLPAYRIVAVFTDHGRLFVTFLPRHRTVPAGREYTTEFRVAVEPVPVSFRPGPSPVPVHGLAVDPQFPGLCAPSTLNVWRCTAGEDSYYAAMVLVRVGGALVELTTARGAAATPQQLLDAGASLYRATPAELAAFG
jgi:hypothetical protein